MPTEYRSGASAGAKYRVIDEPRPGALAHLCVNPYWVMLTLMLGGAWIGWPWFVLNALALGSATKTREIAVAATSFTLNCGLVFGVFYAVNAGSLTVAHARYVLIAVPTLKLGLAYFVFRMQERSYELFTYFGGEERRGAFVLIAGMVGKGAILGWTNTFWTLVLG